MTGEVGTLYLLHFNPPYKHARHYLGFTRAPQKRFKAHVAGRGSRLVRAALAAGCEITVVKTWPGTRDEERRLKKIGGHGVRLCDICRPEHLEKRRHRDRVARSA